MNHRYERSKGCIKIKYNFEWNDGRSHFAQSIQGSLYQNCQSQYNNSFCAIQQYLN